MKLSQLMQMQKQMQEMQQYPQESQLREAERRAKIGELQAHAQERGLKTAASGREQALFNVLRTAQPGSPEYKQAWTEMQIMKAPQQAFAAPTAPKMRDRIAGEKTIQEEFQPDGTWKELSSGPRFARQVAPVINVGGGSKFSHIKDDGQGGFIGLNNEGTMVPIPMGTGAVGKSGTINLAGGRESVQIGRVIQASNQAAKDLENIAKLPLTASSGIFGGRSQGASLFDAAKETLTNTSTTQEVQTYNAMAAGMQRNLAAIESAGLMPPGSLTKQMDAVIMREGDTNLTKMHKLAQARQIIDAAQESMEANPRIPKEQKDHMRTVISRIAKAVPYTHNDLLELATAQEKNPNATLKSVMAGKQQSSVSASENTVTTPDGQTLNFPSGAAAQAFKLKHGLK